MNGSTIPDCQEIVSSKLQKYNFKLNEIILHTELCPPLLSFSSNTATALPRSPGSTPGSLRKIAGRNYQGE